MHARYARAFTKIGVRLAFNDQLRVIAVLRFNFNSVLLLRENVTTSINNT